MRALRKGIVVAKESGGQMTVVVAADARSFAARNLGKYFRDMRKYIIDYRKEHLSKAVETVEFRGPLVRVSVEEGYPVDMMLAKAFDVDADLTIVGRRGLRGIQRRLLGSVSSSVVGRSTCDVLVVKRREMHPTEGSVRASGISLDDQYITFGMVDNTR